MYTVFRATFSTLISKVEGLLQKFRKIFLHILLFQNLLRILFNFAFFSGGGGHPPYRTRNIIFFSVLPNQQSLLFISFIIVLIPPYLCLSCLIMFLYTVTINFSSFLYLFNVPIIVPYFSWMTFFTCTSMICQSFCFCS